MPGSEHARGKNNDREVFFAYVCRQVRETSRKPDEMYSLLERLSPGTRKLEIFARQHNCQPGWVSLGNQVTPRQLGSHIISLQEKPCLLR